MWLLDNLKLHMWLTFAAVVNLYCIALVTISTHSGLQTNSFGISRELVRNARDFLVVQWQRLRFPNAEGLGSIPG